MHNLAHGSEGIWYRQPAYPKVFEELLVKDETNNYILVQDYFQNHPQYSYCMYRIRLFKRKNSNYGFEDVILMSYFYKPTNNNRNIYIFVEAKWTYDGGQTRNFWNNIDVMVALPKYFTYASRTDFLERFNKEYIVVNRKETLLPKYFSQKLMTWPEFLAEYNRPYDEYVRSVAPNSLW
jgi:hypothetical protein